MGPGGVLASAGRRWCRTVRWRGCPGRRPPGLQARRWVPTPIMGTLLSSRISAAIPWNQSSIDAAVAAIAGDRAGTVAVARHHHGADALALGTGHAMVLPFL